MEKIYDVIVVGAGPGGISAAIYAKRSNLDVLLVEKGIPGGQLNQTSEVENYPGYDNIEGSVLSEKMFESVKHLDIEYKRVLIKEITKKEDIFILSTRKGDIFSKSVIIASGCSPRLLGAEGETKLSGSGVSYCAICDGNFFKNQEIFVIGGGDSAIEEAAYLANIGKNVTVVHRREEFRAQPQLLTQLKTYKNVKFLTSSVVEEIIGDDKVEFIQIKNLLTNEITKHKTDAVFIYVGMIPNSKYLNNLGVTNQNGWIETNDKMHSKVEGCFAIGDIREREKRQIVFATNDGAIAGLEAFKFISEKN